MTLRSIPPLRSQRAHSSSMRAATRTGFTFVGAQAKQAPRQPAKDTFIVKTIPPNKAHLAMREAIAKTLSDNRQFWKGELTRREAEFGEEYVEKLKEQLAVIASIDNALG